MSMPNQFGSQGESMMNPMGGLSCGAPSITASSWFHWLSVIQNSVRNAVRPPVKGVPSFPHWMGSGLGWGRSVWSDVKLLLELLSQSQSDRVPLQTVLCHELVSVAK